MWDGSGSAFPAPKPRNGFRVSMKYLYGKSALPRPPVLRNSMPCQSWPARPLGQGAHPHRTQELWREAAAQPMISIPASSASKASTTGSAFHIHAHYLTVKCEAASHLRPPLIYKGKLLALNGLFQCFFDIGDVHLASGKNVTKTGIGTIQINQGLACWYLAGNRMPKTSLTCLKRTNLHRIWP